MKYKGKLYGKINETFYTLDATTDEWDAMAKRITELEAENQALRQSIAVGADNINSPKNAALNTKSMFSKDSEYVLCAAIWFDDGVDTYVHQPRNIKTGFVVCGHRHHNCFTTVAMLMGLRKERMTKKEVQGFLTNKNRFVDRREAAQIAFASGQIKEPKKELFSEDVW